MSLETDPRLLRDTLPLARSAQTELRLMNDSRYLWLVLIPQCANAVEWFDLDATQRQVLFDEVMCCGEVLREMGAYKVNTGALGNVVRQLHIHVLARHEGDPAWPGPVWGHSPAVPYESQALQACRQALARSALASRFDFATTDALSGATTG
jgi:diadenosine tetraphosphate (Ap4A) HIT family hydrolase